MGEQIIRDCDVKVKVGRQTRRCGKPLPNNESTPVTLGTTRYLMDLCPEHIDAMNSAIDPFISIARDTQKRNGTAVRKAIHGKKGAFTTKDVREWLKGQGREVPKTGRLPDDLIKEYQAANDM